MRPASIISRQLRPSDTNQRLSPLCGRRVWLLARVVAFTSTFLVCAIGFAAAVEPRRVLMLHSLDLEIAPFSDFAEEFRDDLAKKSPQPVDFYDASLAMARHQEGVQERPFVEYLLALFDRTKLDLVVAVGAPAANFAQRNRSRLFPSVPMILSIEERRVDRASLTDKDAVVSERIDFPGVISTILQVLPETDNIAVVIGNSPLEKFWLEEMRREFKPFENRVKFEWLNKLSLSDMRKRTAALPPRSAIFYVMVVVDADDVPHKQERVLTELRAGASAPIFSFSDSFLGQGIVGGPLNSHQKLARLAAGVAVRILGGETPAAITTPPLAPEFPVFDDRELRRWDISEERLPAGSIVGFRELSLWHQYGIQVITILVVLLIQLGIIGWLLFERRRRRIAESESRNRLHEVIHLERVAAVGAISASVAHELNQPLGAILLNAETAELLLAANPIDRDRLKAVLTDIRESDQRAGDIIAHLRGLLRKQSEAELQIFDLNDAIRDALRILGPEARKKGVWIEAYSPQSPFIVKADQVHLEQVILNLATNAMDAMEDNAPGTRVMMLETALVGDSEVEVSVWDRGSGIPNGKLNAIFETFYTTKQRGTGLGLSIVRTILETYGGKIWAEDRCDGGTVFRFTLPLAKTHSA
jgi:signal transduction histidine kinase